MKKLWNQNRVLFVLIIILIACFIAIVSVALTFFYARNVSKYGNRLDNIEQYEITDDFIKKYKESFLENENVDKVTFKIKGKIVYVNLTFKDETKLDDAKELANKSLESYEEDIINYYDFEFILKNANFTIIGAKNHNVDHMSWNNNTQIEVEETDEEKQK